MKNKYHSIKEFIKSKREERGLTQQQLAEVIGVKPATLSLYESGDRSPDLNKLAKIAEALKVPLAALLDIQVPKEDLDIALRSQKLEREDIREVRKYIQTLRYAREARDKNEQNQS